jgi:phosphoribosylanthranilate isomerase
LTLRTRTKICGLTNLEDALFAIHSGADALGFVFYPPSPRYINIEQASKIIKQLPPFVTIVGLFVDENIDQIKKTILQVKIDLLQFHGHEDEAFCQQFSRPYIKAIRIKADSDLNQSIEQFNSAKAILLDTYVKGTPGGTGEAFNWDLIPEKTKKPIILAGGLTPDNIQSAIKTVHPYAVDISGGVEKQKGLKDHHKIKSFIQNVNTI